jgi:hypothetical protein
MDFALGVNRICADLFENSDGQLHTVGFDKDSSGKANLMDSPGDAVWGVLYEMEESDLPRLDRVEGGYRRVEIEASDERGNSLVVQTYASEKVTNGARAFERYKKLMLNGAREHQLPEKYIEEKEFLKKRAGGRRLKVYL